MLKIMIVSDSPLRQTGYGRQSRDLWTMFTQLGHEVVFVGMHAVMDGQATEDFQGSKVYAFNGPHLNPDGSWDVPGKHWLQNAVLNEKPDVVILVWDLRKLIGIVRDFDRFFRCPVYFYWLFDSRPISHQYVELMNLTRVRILPITQCISTWLKEINISYEFRSIPEPFDMTKFYQMPEHVRVKLKEKYLGKHADKVCFGFVGGNFRRKNIPLIIEAFYNMPEAYRKHSVLFLHTDPEAFMRNPESYNLKEIVQTYFPEIEDQIVYSKSNNDLSFNMGDIYNVMDWQVSGAIGEGWGLCTVEGMACGIPMIIGDISTSEEIIGDAGIRVPVTGYNYIPNPYLRECAIDFTGFVTAMVEAFKATVASEEECKFPEWDIRSSRDEYAGKYKELQQKAIERVERFDMAKVQKLWGEFFNQLPHHGWRDEMIDEPLLITDGEGHE